MNKEKNCIGFSSGTMKARREWSEIFKLFKEKPTNLEICI
jgi:hypothetical protein